MKFLSLLLFFLVQLNAIGQFYGRLQSSHSNNYTSTYRSAHGQKLSRIKFHLAQIAELTDSRLSYKQEDLKTDTAESKRVSVDQDRKRTYTGNARSYVKAFFTGGLNATYEVWFNHYRISDSIRIVFESEAQYLAQIEEIDINKNYMRLSEDSLVSIAFEFWRKPKHKKLFGKEFMTLNPEKREINVVARYYYRKEYKILQENLLRRTPVEQPNERKYKVSFYADSIKIKDKLIKPDTLILTLDPNGATRFVFWENGINKLSVFVQLEDSEDNVKVKSRIEEFQNGKWSKPSLRIRYCREVIPAGLTRWNTNSAIPFYDFTKEIRTANRIIRHFEDEDGNPIEVNGYLEFTWARE